MPIPDQKPSDVAVDVAAADKEAVDIFGDEPATEPQEVAATEEKKDEAKTKADPDADAETPKEKALREAGEIKDDNLRAMRKRIKELEKGGGKATDDAVDLPYKDVKYSKDLSQDDRDSMTETEIKQMDQIADIQQRVNDDVSKAHTAATTVAEDADDSFEEKLDKGEAKSFARTAALKLAGNDKDIANAILVEYNLFNNEGLSQTDISTRLEKANRMRSDYTPPKQQTHKAGKAIKQSGGGDPFGNDAIVESVTTSGEPGKYSL